MINKRKAIALGLATVMTASVVGCGSSDTTTSTDTATTDTTKTEQSTTADKADTSTDTSTDTSASDEMRTLTIGSWWTQYYDSSHEAVEDDPSYPGLDVAHLKFDNVAKIEEKYNCEFYW